MNTVENIAKFIASRRKQLGMEQKDMYMRIGMKQQQYQRIEAGSDVKLSTLLRVLDGLDLELSIATKEPQLAESSTSLKVEKKQHLLEDDSDDLDFWFNSGDQK